MTVLRETVSYHFKTKFDLVSLLKKVRHLHCSMLRSDAAAWYAFPSQIYQRISPAQLFLGFFLSKLLPVVRRAFLWPCQSGTCQKSALRTRLSFSFSISWTRTEKFAPCYCHKSHLNFTNWPDCKSNSGLWIDDVCPSVHPSVCLSVCLSVRPLVNILVNLCG